MKKIYTMATAIALAATINAQTTIDFENYTLSGVESADDGAAGNGDFDFGGITFYNSYYAPWFSYTGFAITNYTDAITPGWTNQFSAYTGGGHGGSTNYTVCYSNGYIKTNSAEVRIDSFEITNTTYAALSMLYGDSFGKQFGSVLNAEGNIDGTNGEDFFKVWIKGSSFDGSQVDSMEFFLADYRFLDDNLDFILDSWQTIDVNSFGFDVAQLDFWFESSDTDIDGNIYTPTYFALDNVVTMSTAGVASLETAQFQAYPNPVQDVLIVQGGQGQLIVTDASGNSIRTEEHGLTSSIDMSDVAPGVYFVTLVDDLGRYTQKIIK